jgi:hypothetical protein
MFRFSIVILLMALTACAQKPYDPSKPLEKEAGLVVAKIRMSGEVGTAHFQTRNKNKTLDNYSFVIKGSEKLFVFPMSEGTHSFDKVWYTQGSDLLSPDLNCSGDFIIKSGSLNYIGDIYFDVDGANEYIIFSTHSSSVIVRDNYSQTVSELASLYPKITKKLKLNKSVVGPSSCK